MAGEGKDKTTAGVSAINLSQRDLAVVAAAWQSLETEPKIDFEKFTRLAGYGSTDSARVCWRGIKKKLLAAGPSSDASGSSSTTTTTTTTTPKKKSTTATPKKSSAKKATGKPNTPAPSSAVKKEEEAEDGGAMNVDELATAAAGPKTPSSSDDSVNDTPSKPTTQGKKRSRPVKKATEENTEADGSPRKKKGRVTTIKREFDRKEAEVALQAALAGGEEEDGDEIAMADLDGGPEEV